MIPPSFFIKIGEKSPFFIDNGIFYQISPNKTGKEGEKIIKIFNVETYAVPSVKIEELQRIYLQRNEEALHRFKEDYVKSAIKSSALYSERELEELLSKNRAVSFIINEVFPYFVEDEKELKNVIKNEGTCKQEERNPGTGRNSALDEFLKNVQSKASKDFSKIKSQLISEIEKEEEKTEEREEKKSQSSDEEEIRSLLAKKGRISVPSNLAYTGKALDPGIFNKRLLCILGNMYVQDKGGISQYCTLPEFEAGYQRLLEKKLKIEAVGEYENQLKVIAELKEKNEVIQNLLGQGEFSVGDVGFLKNEGHYFVYLKVPEYALRTLSRIDHTSSDYYALPSCRVAVEVKTTGSGRIEVDAPRVVEPYAHPFVDNGHAFEKICLGHYENPGKNSLERVVNYLSTAKKVLMKGYAGDTGPHHRLSQVCSGRKISKKELEKKGIPITNEW